jgi:hypothetical protein
MRHIRLLVSLVFLAIILASSKAQAADFTVTNMAMTAWLINGTANPPLNLTRGRSYTFQVSATGHPFWIKTAQTLGSADAYNTGVTNNGIDSGTVTFTVTDSAPTTLFYQCGIHTPMTGSITITPAVPALGPFFVAVLALTLCGAGFMAYRRRVAVA